MPDNTTGGSSGSGFVDLLTALAPILGPLVAGGIDISRLNTGSQRAQTAANIADPWGTSGRREQYAQQLDAFMKNPGAIFQDPAFQSALNLGLENTSRAAGAAGMSLSGNRLADLQKFGQTFGYQAEQNQFNNLLQLAQPDKSNPGLAAYLYEGGQASNDQALSDLIKQLFGANGSASGLVSALPGLIRTLGSIFSGGDGSIYDLTGFQTPGGATGSFNDILNQLGITGPQATEVSDILSSSGLASAVDTGSNVFTYPSLISDGVDPSTLNTIGDIFNTSGGGLSDIFSGGGFP